MGPLREAAARDARTGKRTVNYRRSQPRRLSAAATPLEAGITAGDGGRRCLLHRGLPFDDERGPVDRVQIVEREAGSGQIYTRFGAILG
ncbi:hypothetical protein AAFF_G00034700 [Aldrovandia affinis]|uniref:Uncharacterized protein n=1 Tax=Aldrovandia affinis TaxID=143900 RepID=A0AAD7S3R4_9TELE|nr:hypothetical protein AAFF_G00034700 [Aldrovandia affinis]